MKVMKQKAQILIPETPMKHIERIGRICYKSEEKIGDGTDRKFIKQLFDNNHHAMLEHYRFILEVRPDIYDWLSKIAPRHMEFSHYDRALISFNARALRDLVKNSAGAQLGYLPTAIQNIVDELTSHIIRKYDCYELFGYDRDQQLPLLSTGVEFIENHPNAMKKEEWQIHGWFSAHMVTDRGISHEIVRHREETSFAQESTRYCNYGKTNEIMVIDQGFTGDMYEYWEIQMENAEVAYLKMVKNMPPQFARSVLPTCLKTEIVMTAPMYEWEHFFNLRMRGTTGAPHPLIKDLSTIVYNDMVDKFLS